MKVEWKTENPTKSGKYFCTYITRERGVVNIGVKEFRDGRWRGFGAKVIAWDDLPIPFLNDEVDKAIEKNKIQAKNKINEVETLLALLKTRYKERFDESI